NGWLLIAGGTYAPLPGVGPNILYDPTADQMIPTPPFLPFSPPESVILLDDGRVLTVGRDATSNYSAIFTPPASNNPAPSLNAVIGNTDSSILEIRGGAFLPNSFVQIGSTKLVTLYLGSKRLVAFVPPALRSTISSGVRVVNPGPGGGPTDRVPVGF